MPTANATKLLPLILEGLGLISSLTKTTKDDDLLGALKIINGVVETLRAGIKGSVSAKEVDAALDSLKASLKAQDAKHKAALEAKFQSRDAKLKAAVKRIVGNDDDQD